MHRNLFLISCDYTKKNYPSQIYFLKKYIIILNKKNKYLTSSNFVTVSLHCGIRCTKLDVVGLLISSLVSRTKSLTVITPGILRLIFFFHVFFMDFYVIISQKTNYIYNINLSQNQETI